MKGKLITFEGIDGAGKSTVISTLRRLEEMKDVIFTREPTETWLGEMVERAIKSDTNELVELFLFTADHAQHVSDVIKPALEERKCVISDRYSDSTYAYQGMTLQSMFQYPMDWARNIRSEWTVLPDKTILFDIEPEIAVKRCFSRGQQIKFEKIDFLKGVRSNYLKLASEEPDRFIVIDSSKPSKELVPEVLDIILPLI